MRKPPQVRPPRRRVARKRRKETLAGALGRWFRTRFQRIGGALFLPKRAFKGIVKDPDYGGVLLVTSGCILVGLFAQYALWNVKYRFYDVDQHREVSLPFPYMNYATSDAVGFVLFSLFLNFVIYYVASWVLRGERDAQTLLMCTGYILSPQLVGRILQVGVSSTLFPTVRYEVSADTMLILMTTSIQLLQYHQRGWAAVSARNADVFSEWQMSAPVLGFRYVTYLFNVWTAVLAVVAVKYVARLSWGKAAVAAGAVLVKDTVFFIQSIPQ